MVEYFDAETLESVGIANVTAPCVAVSQGHKHAPHTHDRWGTGEAACKGYPVRTLYYIPGS